MKSKQTKVCVEFDAEMTEILGAKLANGTLKRIPKNKVGIPLITKKMLRSQQWQSIEEELIKNEFLPE